MAQPKRIAPEKIIFREFRLAKGSIDSPFDFEVNNITAFDFSADLDMSINHAEDLIKADLLVNVSSISNPPASEATCNYHFVFLFQLENLKNYAQFVDDENIDWNPYLANAVASVSYSTARGILMARLQGTAMKDFILPVMDTDSLWNKNRQGL